jgi:ATP-dependent Lon protease
MPSLTPALQKVECHTLKVGCKLQVAPYPAAMADTDTTALALPVVPLPDGVVFPGTVVTLALESNEARAAIAAATSSTDRRVLLVPQVEGRMAHVGVIAVVENAGELPGGGSAAIIRGLQRARLGAGVVTERSGLWVQAEPVPDARPSVRIEALGRELRVVLEEVAEVRRSRRLPEILRTVTDPGALADAATSWAEASTDHKLTILEATELGVRVELVLEWAKQLLAELQVTERIRQDVTEGMEKQQRDFLLRQQLAAIRKELGEGDEDGGDDYRARAAALPLPDAVRTAVDKEIERLERSGQQNPEQGWIRTWLDRVLGLPWGTTTEDNLDLTAAREVLDADHYGLSDVKDRIIEFLAVRKLRAERDIADEVSEDAPVTSRRGVGAIVALVGPPGVGKTSLGESVARAMGRKFVRVSLGGIRDEAEIRGHRRTYVGSQPGRIVRAITEAGSMNPVVLLDEVDKLSSGGWSGDPAAALLEVLDPAQNHTFRDHYLEVDLDLSDVVFLATANMAETIPGPLLDRMEFVRLDGYTEDEKVFIARSHLLPRVLKQAGLRPEEVDLDDDALRVIVTDHTREAGVRGLERELGKAARKVATRVASDPTIVPVHIGPPAVTTYLGRQKFFAEAAEPSLTLTGQLGDVMKESAQIALSYVRSHAGLLGVDSPELARRFHVHVPAGAVPKDGPSAGVTMTTALVSLLTNRPVKSTVGMTGEVTLQGKVLPIGGVKQKVLAAHRAGLTEVILPKRNGADLDDVPERVRDEMTFHLADTVDDVLAHAFA